MTTVGSHGLAEDDIITLDSQLEGVEDLADGTNFVERAYTLQIPLGSSGGSPIIDDTHVDLGVIPPTVPGAIGANNGYSFYTKAAFNLRRVIACDYVGSIDGYHYFARTLGMSGSASPIHSGEKFRDIVLASGTPSSPFGARRWFVASVYVSHATTSYLYSGTPTPFHNEYIVTVHDGTYAMKRKATLQTGFGGIPEYLWTKETDHGMIDCGCTSFFVVKQIHCARRYEDSGAGFGYPKYQVVVNQDPPNDDCNGTYSDIPIYEFTGRVKHKWDGYYYGGPFRKSLPSGGMATVDCNVYDHTGYDYPLVQTAVQKTSSTGTRSAYENSLGVTALDTPIDVTVTPPRITTQSNLTYARGTQYPTSLRVIET